MHLSISSLGPAVDRALQRIHVVCDHHSCRSWQIVRGIPGGRRGIRVGQHWYCSVDCFVQASRTTLFALSSRRVVEIPRNPRLSLGLAMLSRGYLTPAQLQTASGQGQWRKESLDTTLVRLGMATEKQIAAARSVQWGYPVLAQEHIGKMVQSDIPQAILAEYSAIPMHYSLAAKRVLLGFVYRVEHSVLEAIERMTGCRVEPCFITATDLAEQTERFTYSPGYREVPIDDPGSPEKMARALGRAAVDIAAAGAQFILCKNRIWVRLTGKRGIADVIFCMEKAAQEALPAQSELILETSSSLG